MLDIETIRDKWDRTYADHDLPEPARVLTHNAHLLPAIGTALDLACGLGQNALFLSKRGLQVTAWDISSVAIDRLGAMSRRSGVAVDAQIRDVENLPLPENEFDVIVVSHFLNRPLAASIVAALKPGGLLFYQTYTRAKLTPTGPSSPAYLLESQELLDLFAELRVLFYREDGRQGDLSAGLRDEAYFVGQRRCG